MAGLLTLGTWNLALAAALAVVVAVLGLVPAISRRPVLRHALWLLVLVKLVTPPLVPVPILSADEGTRDTALAESPVPVLPVGLERIELRQPVIAEQREEVLHPRVEEEPAESSQVVVNPTVAVRPPAPPERTRSEVTNSVRPAPWTLPGILLVVSLLGTVVLLVRGWSRTKHLARLLQCAGASGERLQRLVREAAARMGVKNIPEVAVIDGHVWPLLWVGRRGPRIVLPSRLVDQLDEDRLRDIVRHELAHYVRRDHWSNGLAFLVTSLWWWNPIAWWARREMRAAQELCCDSRVIDGCPVTRRRYAETLLKVLDFMQSGTSAVPAAGVGFGSGHSLRRRFEMIADSHLSHRWSQWAVLIVITVAALLPCMPTTRAQDESDDSPPAESDANHHHDPSQHSALEGGEAGFVREVIGRHDPDFWQMEDEIAELYRAGLTVFSPEQDWLALVRDGELFVIEVRTGHVAQREELTDDVEGIDWMPGGLRLQMADGGEISFDVTPQVMKVVGANGGPATFNSVVEARVGYSDASTGWSTWPLRDGSVPLAGLADGPHWLVISPSYQNLFHVELPLEATPVERFLREQPTLRSTNINTSPSVYRDEQAGEIIRVEIENRTGDVLHIAEEDVHLEVGIHEHNVARVLSPQWATDNAAKTRPGITIDANRTGQIEINWREWVRDGLWLPPIGEIQQSGPALPGPEPGRVSVRVWARHFGTLPVSVTHPGMMEIVASTADEQPADTARADDATVTSTFDGEQIPLSESTQFLVFGEHGEPFDIESMDGRPLLRLPGRLNLRVNGDGGATARFALSGIPDNADLTLYAALECVPKTPQTARFLEQNAISLQFTEDDIHSASNGFVTKYIYLPHRPPNEKWSGHLATLTMGLVPLERHRRILEGPSRIGFLLAVLRLSDRDPDDVIAPPEVDGTTAEGQSPDVTFEGSEVTVEAITQLTGRDWGTITLMDAQFDGAIIEALRHAGSIRTLRLYGDGLSGQLPRLDHVQGLVALEIGAPLRVMDLEALGSLTQLERLTLPQELALTTTGARQIARLTNLKSLSLYNVDVDDASFAELGTLVNLEELNLGHTRVTDHGLQVLTQMPRLKSLNLHRPPDWYIPEQISDACVPVLRQLTELETLSLSGDITDEGLVGIADLPRLKNLTILNTRITGDGLAALQDSTIESLSLGSGLLGSAPAGTEGDEQILRFMPGLSNIRKCRNLKSVWVIGEGGPEDYTIWTRLAPDVDWGSSS